MNKVCIFDNTKNCNSCGECNKCDLNPKNTCTNCGKCLEDNKSDYREVIVDEINEGNIYDLNDIPLTQNNSEAKDDEIELDEIELIDDINGLSEIISDPNWDLIEEVFPGFYKMKSSK